MSSSFQISISYFISYSSNLLYMSFLFLIHICHCPSVHNFVFLIVQFVPLSRHFCPCCDVYKCSGCPFIFYFTTRPIYSSYILVTTLLSTLSTTVVRVYIYQYNDDVILKYTYRLPFTPIPSYFVLGQEALYFEEMKGSM